MVPRLAQRTRLAVVGAVAVAALGLTACTGGQAAGSSGDVNTVEEGLSGSIDAAVESAMQLSGSTEAVIGVWSADGEYVRGYGESGIDGGARFRAAQTSQPVMCALLLDFVEHGRVQLDDEVSSDLSRQSGIDGVTYEQLCTMRSGIADYKGSLRDIFVGNPTRPWPEQELISEGLALSPLSWPGLDFHSSDTNAVLLGRALRIQSTENLPELLSEGVYQPAGMKSSYYPATSSTTVNGDAMTGLAYPSSGNAPVCEAGVSEITDVSPTMLAGAGATVTTASDLKNFYEYYLGGGFGGEEVASITTDAVETANPERDGEGTPTNEPESNGQQWAFGTEKVESLYGRSGVATGTISAAYHDPTTDYTVVVALNNSSAGAGFARTLAFELAAISQAAGSGPEVSWSAEDQAAKLAEAAICQTPVEEPPAEEAPAE